MRSLNTLSLISASHRLSHACDARSHDPGNSQCSYSDTGNSLKVRKTSEKRLKTVSPIPMQISLIRPSARLSLSAQCVCSHRYSYPIRLFPIQYAYSYLVCLFPTHMSLRLPYPRSTHSSTSNYIVFVSSRCLRAFVGFDFVIESAGFDSPLIYLTSVISRRS